MGVERQKNDRSSEVAHEILFRQLREISQVIAPVRQHQEEIQRKMQKWEESYRVMREVEDCLVQAYSDLSIPQQTQKLANGALQKPGVERS